MKLKYVRQHISIKQFTDLDLPDFFVLTGKNGSGKSHLLQAVKNGSVQIDSVPVAQVFVFDATTFAMKNEAAFAPAKSAQQRATKWAEWNTNLSNKNSELAKLNEILTPYTILIEGLTKQEGVSIVDLSADFLEDSSAKQAFANFIVLLTSSRGNSTVLKGLDPKMLEILARIDVIPANLTEVAFNSYYDVASNNGVLPNSLGEVFADYHSNREKNAYTAFRNNKYGENVAIYSESEFESKYGKKPWEVINDILCNVVNLPYSVTFPEDANRDSPFSVKLKRRDNFNLSVNFDNLSSGEKTLMALVASVYLQTSKNSKRPDVLLLDELDASLHPSMIKALIETLHRHFVEQGCKIILVTHSPTTIALAPPESIFMMDASANPMITKIDQASAVNTLSEGFMTLEKGMALFNSVATQKVNVFSEGRNINFIKKAFDFAGLTDVQVVSGFENGTGEDQLKSLFNFFQAASPSNHVLFVWDHDSKAPGNLSEKTTVHKFKFIKNNDSLAPKGIENLFPNSLFEDFKTTVTSSKGVTNEYFDTNRKPDFEKYIIARNNKADFQNFGPLIEKVKTLLGDTPKKTVVS